MRAAAVRHLASQQVSGEACPSQINFCAPKHWRRPLRFWELRGVAGLALRRGLGGVLHRPSNAHGDAAHQTLEGSEQLAQRLEAQQQRLQRRGHAALHREDDADGELLTLLRQAR